MMPATFTRFWWFLMPGTLAIAPTGCGGIASSNKAALTQGNWSVTALSSNSNTPVFNVGGNLTQVGQALSGTMHIAGSPCFDVSQPVLFTGNLVARQVTLTSASDNGQVIALGATETGLSALSGTYTITGGCGGGDSGTVVARAVPAIKCTWSGSVTGSGGRNVSIAMALTQATVASADGTFALSGSIAFTGSNCSVSGTVNDSSIAGSYIVMNGTTVEADNSVGTFSYTKVLLGQNLNSQDMIGTYEVDFGLCDGDVQS